MLACVCGGFVELGIVGAVVWGIVSGVTGLLHLKAGRGSNRVDSAVDISTGR